MKLLTSESVTEGHPDKIADAIGDAILDAILAKDQDARVAAEVLVTNGFIVVAGEITTSTYVEIQDIVREVIKDIGYDKPELGFHWQTCGVLTSIHEQSPDIARGVAKKKLEEIGAGDQGIVYGYATDETKELMPLPIVLAHRLTWRLAEIRKKKILPWLRPDGKSQVTIGYLSGKPKEIATILVSAQHDPSVKLPSLRKGLIEKVILPIIPKSLITPKTRILVNPTGRFVLGGPVADTGLTGRKNMVDTYGGIGAHGGGSFSGKDPTKVDRSGAYAARWAAKNIVAAKLAKKAEVKIAYAIGLPKPLAVTVNTFGTGVLPDEVLTTAVSKVFDFRPGMIIKALNLRRPIYRQTSCYGHFGRLDLDLPWEKTNRAAQLKRVISSLPSKNKYRNIL